MSSTSGNPRPSRMRICRDLTPPLMSESTSRDVVGEAIRFEDGIYLNTEGCEIVWEEILTRTLRWPTSVRLESFNWANISKWKIDDADAPHFHFSRQWFLTIAKWAQIQRVATNLIVGRDWGDSPYTEPTEEHQIYQIFPVLTEVVFAHYRAEEFACQKLGSPHRRLYIHSVRCALLTCRTLTEPVLHRRPKIEYKWNKRGGIKAKYWRSSLRERRLSNFEQILLSLEDSETASNAQYLPLIFLRPFWSMSKNDYILYTIIAVIPDGCFFYPIRVSRSLITHMHYMQYISVLRKNCE